MYVIRNYGDGWWFERFDRGHCIFTDDVKKAHVFYKIDSAHDCVFDIRNMCRRLYPEINMNGNELFNFVVDKYEE